MRRRYLAVVPRPMPAAPRRYLAVVHRPLSAAPLVERRRYLFVAWWDAGGIFACPDTDSFSARCQNQEGHCPLAVHTALYLCMSLFCLLRVWLFAMGRVLT